MDNFKKGFSGFMALCLEKKDQKELAELFDLFFTPEEKSDLAMRFLIIEQLLLGKKTQREIAKDLSVSIAKITRGSNELKRISPQLIKLLTKKLT